MTWLFHALRRYDLEYWQLREALGYSIPIWVDVRWPRRLAGNCGQNPYKCGKCAARLKYPELYREKEGAKT